MAVVDGSGRCMFRRLPGGPAPEVGAWLAPVTGGPGSGDVLVVDGPLGRGADAASATLLEAYPGATWSRLAGRRLPRKGTRAGVLARTRVLRAAGRAFPRAPATHDELDAALCAWLGWRLRRGGVPGVRFVGPPCHEDAGCLREGAIVDVEV